MTIRRNPYPIFELTQPRHVLLSVFDKTGLSRLVEGLIDYNPEVMLYSTTGTEKKILEILEAKNLDPSVNYLSVEEFSGLPETKDGLVKTLTANIAMGLLAERGNPEHKDFMTDILPHRGKEGARPGVYFDMLVCNFYPFFEVVAKPGISHEEIRDNEDIGGPNMVRAAAKNWQSVAGLVNPCQYEDFLASLMRNKGIPSRYRFDLAKSALGVVADYCTAINDQFKQTRYEDVAGELEFVPGEVSVSGEVK